MRGENEEDFESLHLFLCGCSELCLQNILIGCDGSVLIDTIARNKAEKESCPRTVSCADIFTFIARDCVTRLGGFHYAVLAGRRDGTVSSMLEVLQNLSDPFSNVQNLKNQFGVKGLSMDEMVTLSWAHSIGVSHYTSSTRRLYPRQDTSIDPVFATQLKASCLQNGRTQQPSNLMLSALTGLTTATTRTCRSHGGLFFSDQILWHDPATKNTVGAFANDSRIWAVKFTTAMIHMGTIEVKIGEEGEIRNNCGVVN